MASNIGYVESGEYVGDRVNERHSVNYIMCDNVDTKC